MMGQTDTETNIKVVKNMLVLCTLGKACSSNNVPLRVTCSYNYIVVYWNKN